MAPLKTAVIGCGHLGKFHTRILAGMPDVQLVGVVDSVAPAAEDLATQYDVEWQTDYRKLSTPIEAVVLAVPTKLHHRIGIELLSRGIHLLVEKPLALTFSQGDEMVRAARRSGAVLAVGHVERFNPVLTAAGPYLKSPKYVTANRLVVHSMRSTDIGAVLDLMIHDLDLLLHLVREPVEHVEALGISVLGGAEDVANARLTFSDGCVASLNASRVSFTSERSMQIWSEQAYAGLDFVTRTATVVRPSQQVRDRQIDLDRLTPSERLSLREELFTRHLQKEQFTADPVDQLTAELTDFVQAAKTGGSPAIDGVDACRALALAERILAKIDIHRWDGSPDGRCGPLLQRPLLPPIPSPHWNQVQRPASHSPRAGNLRSLPGEASAADDADQ